MLSQKQIKKFRKCVNHLKEHISTTLPVRVYLTSGDFISDGFDDKNWDYDGSCYKSEKSIIIQVNNRSYEIAINVLIHEFAHAYLIDTKDNYSHSQEWGKMYAKCYNLVWDTWDIWEEK